MNEVVKQIVFWVVFVLIVVGNIFYEKPLYQKSEEVIIQMQT